MLLESWREYLSLYPIDINVNMRLCHPVPVCVCGHVGTGEKFPLPLRLRPSSDVHKNIPSSLFRRGREARAAAAAAIVHRDSDEITAKAATPLAPPCGSGVDPVAPFGSKKGKCQNLSPAILFWLLFLPPHRPLSLSLSLPSSSSEHPSSSPLVSPPQKAIINLHFITQLQKKKKQRKPNIQHPDRYCAAGLARYPSVLKPHEWIKWRLGSRLSAVCAQNRFGSSLVCRRRFKFR